jgi:hypothetical protein
MMTDPRTTQCIIDMVRTVWCTDDPIDESWYAVRRIDILLAKKRET